MNLNEMYNDWADMIERKNGDFISEEEFEEFCHDHVCCWDDYMYAQELLATYR